MWHQGLNQLMGDTINASHPLVIERWLRKEFYALVNSSTQWFAVCLDSLSAFPIMLHYSVAMKHMKPFVQTRLQYKCQSKQLQEITEVCYCYAELLLTAVETRIKNPLRITNPTYR